MFLPAACFALLSGFPQSTPLEQEQQRWSDTSAQVEIIRDNFGVPHVYGPTDASVVFGYMYARCEDRFSTIEGFYLRALGRLSEVAGEAGLANDIIMRAMEVDRLSQAEYENADPQFQAICQAFADGINYYLLTHPEEKPMQLTRFEPWHALAGQRAMWSLYGFNWNGISDADVLSTVRVEVLEKQSSKRSERLNDAVALYGGAPAAYLPGSATLGCNEWAVGPSRSASSNAMLLLDLHIPFGAAYEGHLFSEEGYRVSGSNAYGDGIFPIMGFNDHLGWAFTNNFIDWVDLYSESFDDPKKPTRYRYGEDWLEAQDWTSLVKVATEEGGMETRRIHLRKTQHGPILATRDGKPIAVRVALIEEGGVLEQIYHMGKASTLAEFQAALDENALVNQNLLYADDAGNIYYVYNGLMPKRPEGFDWSKPVDGSDPKTEWLGVHGLLDRPQLLNPESGLLQNCNSSPFSASTGDNPDPGAFPSYMVGPGDQDNRRARESRRLLASQEKFTFEEWARLPFSSHLPLEGSFDALFAKGAEAAADDKDVLEAIEFLKGWNFEAQIDCAATTLAVYATEITPGGKEIDVKVLKRVMDYLEKGFGTWRVAWGDVNRLQRAADSQHSDKALSLPVAGTSVGGAFAYLSRQFPGTVRRYGFHGHAFTCVVEFGEHPRARSIVPFGQSDDPTSKHYFDQAPFYATGQMKPVQRDRDELLKTAERAYHPGGKAIKR